MQIFLKVCNLELLFKYKIKGVRQQEVLIIYVGEGPFVAFYISTSGVDLKISYEIRLKFYCKLLIFVMTNK